MPPRVIRSDPMPSAESSLGENAEARPSSQASIRSSASRSSRAIRDTSSQISTPAFPVCRSSSTRANTGRRVRIVTSPVAVVTRTGRLYADAGRYPPLPASFSIATRTRPAGTPSPAAKSRSCSSRAANVVRSSSRKSDIRR